jgi:hypothetical protein
VRGVGDKAALPFGLVIDQAEQAIQGVHQGPHLGGGGEGVNRAEVARTTSLHGILEIKQRLERPRNGPIDRKPGRQHQYEVGQQHLEHNRVHPLLARVRAVSQLHNQLAG